MDLEYLAERYRRRLYQYWYEDDSRTPGTDVLPGVFLAAFTPDNCVLQFESCLEYCWDPKDWVRVCYQEAKMYVVARDQGMKAAIKWKLGEWDAW